MLKKQKKYIVCGIITIIMTTSPLFDEILDMHLQEIAQETAQQKKETSDYTSTVLITLEKDLKDNNTENIEKFITSQLPFIDINGQNNNGKTPLMLAIQYNNIMLIDALLPKKPNTLIQDNSGQSALLYAINNNNTSLYAPIITLWPKTLTTMVQNRLNAFNTIECSRHTNIKNISTELLKKYYGSAMALTATRVAQHYLFGKYAQSPLLPLGIAIATTSIEQMAPQLQTCLLESLHYQEKLNAKKAKNIEKLKKEIMNNTIKTTNLNKNRILSLIDIHGKHDTPIASLLTSIVQKKENESLEIIKTIRLFLAFEISNPNEKVSPKSNTELPDTLIGYATRNNLINTVGILLENNVDLDRTTTYNTDAPRLATAVGLQAINIGAPEAIGEAISGTMQDIKHVMIKGLKSTFINTTNMEVGMNAFIQAIQKKHYEIATLLLAAGININKQDSTGKTALMYAIANKDQKSIELIINSNQIIDVSLKDKQQWGILTYAIAYTIDRENPFSLFNTLIDYIKNKKLSYNPNLIDNNGKTIAHYLITEYLTKQSDKTIIHKLEDLAQLGLNVNAHGPKAQHLLYYALHKKASVELIRCLLELGANPNTLYNTDAESIDSSLVNGSNTLTATIEHYNNQNNDQQLIDIIETLLICGTHPNHENSDGVTPLFYAIIMDKPLASIVKLLLIYGADQHITPPGTELPSIIIPLNEILNKIYSPETWFTKLAYNTTNLAIDLKNQCEIVSLLIMDDNTIKNSDPVKTLIDNIYKKIDKSGTNKEYFDTIINPKGTIEKKNSISCAVKKE